MKTMVCAVCERVLTHYSGKGWAHTLNDELAGADHPAVPVEPDDVTPRLRCDFCSADDPGWVLPADRYEIGLGHYNEGDWAACDTCAHLVERNEWNGLARRALAVHEQRHGPAPGVEDGLRHLYRQLRTHITGPVHRRDPRPS